MPSVATHERLTKRPVYGRGDIVISSKNIDWDWHQVYHGPVRAEVQDTTQPALFGIKRKPFHGETRRALAPQH